MTLFLNDHLLTLILNDLDMILCATTFGTVVLIDSTSADFPNTIAPKSVEGIALTPVGNPMRCVFNLSTDRVVKSFIRKNDSIPTTQRLLNSLTQRLPTGHRNLP